ncbi:MAG TPA: hypothetical protein VK324_09070 [Tepidisphaeraceae bacterium]|nr:hypothetical protein [Tepidisphaeraceae bacterium]
MILTDTRGAIVPLGYIDEKGRVCCPHRDRAGGPFLPTWETGFDARDGYEALRVMTPLMRPSYDMAHYMILAAARLDDVRPGEHLVVELEGDAPSPTKADADRRWRTVHVGAFAGVDGAALNLDRVVWLPVPSPLPRHKVVNVWRVVKQVAANPYC